MPMAGISPGILSVMLRPGESSEPIQVMGQTDQANTTFKVTDWAGWTVSTPSSGIVVPWGSIYAANWKTVVTVPIGTQPGKYEGYVNFMAATGGAVGVGAAAVVRVTVPQPVQPKASLTSLNFPPSANVGNTVAVTATISNIGTAAGVIVVDLSGDKKTGNVQVGDSLTFAWTKTIPNQKEPLVLDLNIGHVALGTSNEVIDSSTKVSITVLGYKEPEGKVAIGKYELKEQIPIGVDSVFTIAYIHNHGGSDKCFYRIWDYAKNELVYNKDLDLPANNGTTITLKASFEEKEKGKQPWRFETGHYEDSKAIIDDKRDMSFWVGVKPEEMIPLYAGGAILGAGILYLLYRKLKRR